MNLEYVNTINIIATMLIFIYAIYIVPKCIGESRGIYMEKPEEFFGKFELDCKWTHGTTYSMGALGFILIVPLLLLWEQVMIHMGMTAANICILLILIPLRIYYEKQRAKNTIEAYQKNIEEGYIKETENMPNTQTRLKKIYDRIIHKK